MSLVRPAVADLPDYVPGRTSADVRELAQLASNESPFPPLPSVLTAMAGELPDVHRYPLSGSPRLRAALAAHHGVEPAQVSVGAGSVAVLAHLCSAVLEPGRSAVYPWRSFEAYPLLARITGGEGVAVPLRGEALDLPALQAAVTADTRLLLVCSPNNPTGSACDAGELGRLLDDVPDTCLVVLDEAYVDYVERELRPPVDRWLAEHPNLVLLRTFSKAHGLAGLRIGYSVSPPDIARAIGKVTVPFTVTALAERAALASLAATGELAERVAYVQTERTRVADALRAAGLPPAPSQGNFLWVPDAVRPAGLARRLAGTGVLVRDFPEGTRITIGSQADDDRLLAALPDTLVPTPR